MFLLYCISQPMRNNEVVLLTNCWAWRGELVINKPSQSSNTVNMVLVLLQLWNVCATLLFLLHSLHHPQKPSESSDYFHRGMFKLNTKFDADSLLCWLSHLECNSHTVHVFIQWCLPPALTSTVKFSLFTHVHSNPLFSAANLYWHHANSSHDINNGWNFSGQTSYIHTKRALSSLSHDQFLSKEEKRWGIYSKNYAKIC